MFMMQAHFFGTMIAPLRIPHEGRADTVTHANGCLQRHIMLRPKQLHAANDQTDDRSVG